MIIQNSNFNIMQIAESGQCFRMNRVQDSDERMKYGVVAYGEYLEITQLSDDQLELSCSEEEYHRLWEDYFDLTYDYGKLVKNLIEGEDLFLSEAAEFGKGIRILKQEPYEAAISFIISQNKNIPAIKSCIEAICTRYGERKVCEKCGGKEYFTFPAPKVLAEAIKEDLRALKTGYRDTYIISISKAIAEGSLNLDELKHISFEKAVRTLKKIRGVGDKVANCIALYGLHHISGFPVDVWILRVLDEIYQNQFELEKYAGYAGIVQQYMFYYMRHKKGVA
jgi:N-glycosylase/DNA lyase